MFNTVRYWLSAELLGWSVWLIPDEEIKYIMRFYLAEALKQIEVDYES